MFRVKMFFYENLKIRAVNCYMKRINIELLVNKFSGRITIVYI